MTDIEIKVKSEPRLLYHYTSYQSVFNIINSKKLWTTQIQYLNDETEFKYAGRIARKILNSKLSLELSDDDNFFYSQLLEKASFDHGANTFIFSLSEESDLLSQWRGYCKESGIAMGFNYIKLEKLSQNQKYVLLPCIYNISEQKKIINSTIEDCKKIHIENKNNENYPESFWGVFNARFSFIAKFIKHSTFQEEKEWRLVGGPFNTYDDKYKMRPIKNMLLPYYEFDLSEDNDLGLEEFIIGPNKDILLSIRSFIAFTRKINKKWRVRRTGTSYKSE